MMKVMVRTSRAANGGTFFLFFFILFEIKSTWKILHVNVSSIILWIHKYKGTECITLLSEGHSTSPGRAIMLSCLMKVQGRSCRFVYRAPHYYIIDLYDCVSIFASLLTWMKATVVTYF